MSEMVKDVTLKSLTSLIIYVMCSMPYFTELFAALLGNCCLTISQSSRCSTRTFDNGVMMAHGSILITSYTSGRKRQVMTAFIPKLWSGGQPRNLSFSHSYSRSHIRYHRIVTATKAREKFGFKFGASLLALTRRELSWHAPPTLGHGQLCLGVESCHTS